MNYEVAFDTIDVHGWIETISNTVNKLELGSTDSLIIFVKPTIDISELEALHLVTLACLIDHYDRRGTAVELGENNTPVRDFLFDTLQMQKYWIDKDNYTEAQDNTVLNLWRIQNNEKEVHSQRVHDFLKSDFFRNRNKDFSAVKNSLDEVYYNVFDHAEANGNAFSFIKYDDQNHKLYVAVCDFGMGIAKKVRNHFPGIHTDHEAIEKAMEDTFTTHSQLHNAGMGLGNIRNACTDSDALKIISNRGSLSANKEQISSNAIDFDFNGTLIYYELSLNHYEDEEIIDNFEF
jgi:anti-sigma regulatory factor (Ser/Thr protein kinase)